MKDPRNIFSPIVISVFITLLGLSSIVFPKEFYERVLFEHNYMFLNLTLLGLVLLCLLGFLLGSMIASYVAKTISVPSSIRFRQIDSTTFTLLFIFTLIFSGLRLFSITRGLGINSLIEILHPSRMMSITEYRSTFDKLASDSSVLWIGPFSFVAAIYLIYGAAHLKGKYILFPAIIILINFVEAFISQTRGELILVIGYASLSLGTLGIESGRLKIQHLYRYTLGIILVFTSLFVFIDMMRGGMLSGDSGGVYTFMGYFVAEFNRLALILSGDLTLPEAGRQSYAFYNLLYPPLSNKLPALNFGSLLGFSPPQSDSIWSNSFRSVKDAGLNENFNWFTIFGSIFSDLHWYSPLWFIAYGSLCGTTWELYRKNTILGRMLYPWFWLSIMTWWGAFNVLVSSPDTIWLIFFAVLMSVYSQFTVSRKQGGFHVSYRFSSRNL